MILNTGVEIKTGTLCEDTVQNVLSYRLYITSGMDYVRCPGSSALCNIMHCFISAPPLVLVGS